MSAFSSLTGAAAADSWPVAGVLPGMSAVPLGHAIDLALFFPNEERERHDALIVETRRHLGGCVTAIEAELRRSLADQADIAAILGEWPASLCWPTICAQPTLLGPALLAHMQMRAGVSLMLRRFERPDGDRPDDGEADAILSSDDPAVGEALAALALAEGRWLMNGAEDEPMQPDLPGEHFAELVWTAAACLLAVAQRAALAAPEAMLPAFERAGWALLARYDERAGPIAAADQLVRQLGARGDAPELLGSALGQRRFLLFAALAARRLRMSSVQVTDILVLGPVAQVAALCRALGGSDADYRHLLMALRPVRPSLSDAAIVGEAERYQALTDAQADATVSALRAPAALRTKLDHLRRITA